MNILVTIPANETHKKWLEDKAPGHTFVYRSAKEIDAACIGAFDIIIGNVSASLLPDAAKLQWLQLNSAGADTYCLPGVLPPQTKLTNATGAYGLALAEHMLAALFAMQKKLYLYHDNQKKALWQDEGSVTSVYGSTALILGLGDIGGAFARRVKALGAYTIGVKRRPAGKPEYIDEMGNMAELKQLLSRADIVAMSLPGTPETHRLMDDKHFARMKKGAYFLNVGRGNTVVTEALCDAVASGHLAGAAVDVTDPEPLPPTHRMWKIPNIHITPHISGQYHLAATLDNIVRIAAENLTAFLAGKPLRNEVDFTTGYKK